ncbi:head-tail connector protein [[Clostridium] colinum]|uniref:hypothetical protein n=1 Tax=[Clostridium] colinum TaxID=36835 RepID=UPI0020247080|nr:hypothetical protein [[Clostridium] colinum]
MYLSYEKYKEYGGVVEEKNYAFFELQARKKLDYWTLDRISNFLEKNKENIHYFKIIEDIELCMFLIIEEIYQIETGEADVSSVSNDGISMSFVDAKTSEQKLQDLYQKVVEILPLELVSVAI